MTIKLKIDGMHCSGCASAVRRVLEATPSVTSRVGRPRRRRRDGRGVRRLLIPPG